MAKRFKHLVVVIVVLILAVILTVASAIGSRGYTEPIEKWFNGWGGLVKVDDTPSLEDPAKPNENDPSKPGEPSKPAIQSETGNSLMTVNDNNNGIELAASQISRELFATYSINAYADSAYTITATVTPENATHKEIEYSARWKNAASEWATGKDVKNYVTVTQAEVGSATATVTVRQSFSEQIEVVARLTNQPELSAVTTVDYICTGASLKVWDTLSDGRTLSFGEYSYAENYPEFSFIKWTGGTIAPDSANAVEIYYDISSIASLLEENGIAVKSRVYTEPKRDMLFDTPDDANTFSLESPNYLIGQCIQNAADYDKATKVYANNYYELFNGNDALSCEDAMITVNIRFYRAYQGKTYGTTLLDYSGEGGYYCSIYNSGNWYYTAATNVTTNTPGIIVG